MSLIVQANIDISQGHVPESLDLSSYELLVAERRIIAMLIFNHM